MGQGARKKALLCPQCGLHRFFLKVEGRGNVYFHVGLDGLPFPTEASGADLSGLEFTRILCTGCSWKGSPGGLVRVFRY